MSYSIRVTEEQIRTFVQAYIDRLKEMTAKYKSPERALLFPDYLSHCFYVKAVISKTHGVAIEFVDKVGDWESDNWKISVEETEEGIESSVLPVISASGNGFFEIAGNNIVLENLNLITEDFYAKYKHIIDPLSRATNLIGRDFGWFIKVKDGGDVRLIDVGIARVINDMDIARKIKFLWMIGTNRSEFFTIDRAKKYAEEDVRRYLSRLIPKIPLSLLFATLQHYIKLINTENIKEEDLQKFLYYNPYIIELTAVQVEIKPKLSEKHIPDFLIEKSFGEYIIVELEHPHGKLFTREKRLPESRELRNAKAQIEKYLHFVRNNILYLKQKYPKLSVEKIQGMIIIGLSSTMDNDEKERLNQLNYNLKDYKIFTYDQLAQVVKAFLEKLGVRYGPFG